MPLSEARRKANDKYIKEKYERLPVSYPKEFCSKVRAAAIADEKSLAQYVRDALEKEMNSKE